MSYRSSRLNCTLGKTRFLILGLFILAAALAACGGGGGGEAMTDAQEVGEGGGPAAYKPPAVPAEVKFIKEGTHEFVELRPGPGLESFRIRPDVGVAGGEAIEGWVAISSTMECVIAEWENMRLDNWTVQYDEYLYGLDGVLTLETEEYGVFELGPGDAIWLPEGTTLSYSAKEKAKTLIVLYPADWEATLSEEARLRLESVREERNSTEQQP